MTRRLLIVFALVACGGKSNPAPKPVEEAKPDEAKPADTTASETKPDEVKAPEPAKEPDPSVVAQAQLAEQYDAGKKVYSEKKCATCHGDAGAGDKKNPPVIGEKAFPEKAPKAAKVRKKVVFKTAKDVLDFVKAKMPAKEPGTLTDDEAAAVTAWLLSESKVKIEKKLDGANAGDVKLR